MIKKFLTTIYFSFILLLILAVSSVNAKIPDAVSEQKNAVVTVYVDDKNGNHVTSGGGFIVDQNGIIVTNCQVIVKWFEEVQNKIVAVTESGTLLPIRNLISSKCENGLALFKVDEKGLPTVKLAEDYKPEKGESIFVIGGPSVTETTVSDGTIKSINKKGKIIQISIPVTPEISGSPVFNNKGEAFGAATFLTKKDKNLNLAVPLKNIVKQLNEYRNIEEKFAGFIVPSLPPPVKKPPVERKTKEHKVKKQERKKQEGEKKEEKKQKNANEYFMHGCSYLELSMYKEAIKLYKQSLKIKPDFADVYVNLGVAYYKLGNYTDSIDAYKRAIRIKPNSPAI
jgi:S1-C subfamily serine protease